MDFKPAHLFKNTRSPVVESRVPAHLLDILELATLHLDVDDKTYQDKLLRYFLTQLAQRDLSKIDIARLLENGLIKGRPQRSIYLNSTESFRNISTLKAKTRLKDASDIIKLTILEIYRVILRQPSPEAIHRIKSEIASHSG